MQNEVRIQQTGLIESYNIKGICNAIIAGFVSITASCDSVRLWQSTLIGFIGCMVYSHTRKLLKRFEIDDPLHKTQVHGLCGFWAILARGIFDADQGIFSTGKSQFFIIQLLGGLTIAVSAACLSFVFFYTIKL